MQLANQNVAIKINAAALATLGDLDSLKEEFVERIDGVRNTLDNKLQESKSELETKLSQAKSALQTDISNTETKVKSYSDNKDKALNDKFHQLILGHVEQLTERIATNNTGLLLADRNLRNDFEKRLGDEKRFREDAVNELAIQLNSLVSNVQTLDRNIQQSFYNKRRAPATWTLDRTTTPWTIWFDNGCGIQFPDYPTSGSMYGYGHSFENTLANKFAAYPLVYNIINCARGVLTLEDFVKREGGDYVYWSPTTKVLDPIQDARKYNWTNAVGNRDTNNDSLKRKPNFARVMYELGIWSDADVESLGAVRR